LAEKQQMALVVCHNVYCSVSQPVCRDLLPSVPQHFLVLNFLLFIGSKTKIFWLKFAKLPLFLVVFKNFLDKSLPQNYFQTQVCRELKKG
jgi:hypothetical protein